MTDFLVCSETGHNYESVLVLHFSIDEHEVYNDSLKDNIKYKLMTNIKYIK